MVFACGHPLHGDASVAHEAVMVLPPELLALAEVKLIGALKPEYLRDLPAGVGAVIVDAVVGPEPGSIVEVPLIEMSGRSEEILTTSTHPLTLDQVVAMAQLLRDEPVQGLFVGLGIEPITDAQSGELSEGVAPTGPMKEAIPALRDTVAHALEALSK